MQSNKLESYQICKFYTKELQVKISFCMGQLEDIFGHTCCFAKQRQLNMLAASSFHLSFESNEYQV